MQTDRPIQKIEEDRLDRIPFARRIASVIQQRVDPAPLVIGIYGPWGDGKSSCLNLTKAALDATSSVIQVDYNPWFFSSNEDNLIRSFFLVLGETLERRGLFAREKIAGLLKKYGALIPKYGSVAEAAGRIFFSSDLRDLRSRVETILNKHKTPVVVFIDDIDRLDRREIQTLFKLIRLSADFPYVTYVLTFDDAIVSAALGEAYESGDAKAGRRFLEKIIQLPLHMPAASSERLRHLTFEGVERILKTNAIELPEPDTYAFANAFALSFETLLRTPRQAKMYDNALAFAVPALVNEAYSVDVLLLEAIRIFIPKLYLSIRDNSEQFLRPNRGINQEWATDALIKSAGEDVGLGDEEITALKRHTLERMFPRVSNAIYGNDWENTWAKEKRICSPDYFSRYFSYGVRTGDIPDALVTETVVAAALNDRSALARHFAAVAKQGAFSIFLRKIRGQETELPEKAALPLIVAIASSAHALPREPGMMSMNWTIMQAAILTSHSAQKVTDNSERFVAVREAIEASTSFLYSVEVLRWTRYYEEKGEQHGFLNEEQMSELAARIMKRLLQEANGRPLYRFLGEDTTKILLPLTWYTDTSPVRDSMAEAIRTEGADGAEALIEYACGKSWEMQTGIPHVSEVRKDVYDCMAKLISPDLLLEVLLARYGAKMDSPHILGDRTRPLGERLAVQFASAHKAAQDQKDTEAKEQKPPSGEP